MKIHHWLILITLLLSVLSLFLEQTEFGPGPIITVIEIVDYLIIGTAALEILLSYSAAKYKKLFFRDNRFSLTFFAVFVLFFTFNKTSAAGSFGETASGNIAVLAIILRGIFLSLKIYGRINKLARYLERFTDNPAKTTLMSFLLVILTGSLILMMKFTTVDGRGLPFVDALFTATSAVCVTGLIVTDTAVRFTVWGQGVILALIQIGGLGIMILSYFTIFTVRRRVSLADKLLLSYMLSEEDMSGLSRTLSSIVITTLVIEAAGALLLFIGFAGTRGFRGETVFFAVFHSVSAFCNAGFALFSDSLEGFRSNPLVLGTVAFLIIAGGLGFGVITNLRASVTPVLGHPLSRRRRGKKVVLSLHSRVVLASTGILIVTGIFFIYLFEHGGAMKTYGLAEQYLSAFFQSVTLRTAGFNSIPIGTLRDATLLVMVLYMFIGAGSGGTAGGIKVGSLAVILSSLRSFLKKGKSVTLGQSSLSQDAVTRSFLILIFGLGAVFTGTVLLTLTESAPFSHLLFEATSAFGTVGLSAGVTGSLSLPGKLTVIVLMYLGRLGPLTILSAASSGKETSAVSFPQGEISIG